MPFSMSSADPMLVANANVGSQLLNAQFQHIQSADPNQMNLVAKTNLYIDEVNSYLSDVSTNADPTILAVDLAMMGSAISAIADEMDLVGYGSLSFSQSALDAAQATIVTNGLPQWELDYLNAADLDQDYVEMFTDMHLVVDISEFGSPTISGILRQAAEAQIDAAVEVLMYCPIHQPEPIDETIQSSN